MAAPYSDLESKTEVALKTEAEKVSLANRGNAPVLLGLECDVEVTLPCVICTATRGEEYPAETGNYWMDCTIEIRSSATESLATHRSRSKYVIDQFAVDQATLATTLTANLPDFACMGIVDRQLIGQKKEDRHVITGVSFRALCCPSDL